MTANCADGPLDWRALEGGASVRRDRQPLAAFGPATLQHDAPVLGPHPDKKPMRAAASAVVGLKGALHRWPFPLGRAGNRRQDPADRGPAWFPRSPVGRTINGSERLFRLSIRYAWNGHRNRRSGGASVCYIQRSAARESAHELTATGWGFLPKFSTPVEKIV